MADWHPAGRFRFQRVEHGWIRVVVCAGERDGSAVLFEHVISPERWCALVALLSGQPTPVALEEFWKGVHLSADGDGDGPTGEWT